MARDCPKEPQGPTRHIKAIEDGPLAAVAEVLASGVFNGFFVVYNEGYQTVGKGERRNEPSGGVAGAMGVLPVEVAAETPGQNVQEGHRAHLHRGRSGSGTRSETQLKTRPMPTSNIAELPHQEQF